MTIFIIILALSASPLDNHVEPPSLFATLVARHPSRDERVEVELQISRCKRNVSHHADPYRVLALLRYETVLGVPEDHRGLLGAAWCWENAMRSEPVVGDNGASHGAFQMQAWFWHWCRLPMQDEVMGDLLISAACYWSRVEHYLDDGKCPGNVTRAEAMAANGPKYKPHGCAAASKHSLELARWRE